MFKRCLPTIHHCSGRLWIRLYHIWLLLIVHANRGYSCACCYSIPWKKIAIFNMIITFTNELCASLRKMFNVSILFEQKNHSLVWSFYLFPILPSPAYFPCSTYLTILTFCHCPIWPSVLNLELNVQHYNRFHSDFSSGEDKRILIYII